MKEIIEEEKNVNVVIKQLNTIGWKAGWWQLILPPHFFPSFGSGSGLDPDSIGSVYLVSDPDPGRHE
jgi:hypothetical protein